MGRHHFPSSTDTCILNSVCSYQNGFGHCRLLCQPKSYESIWRSPYVVLGLDSHCLLPLSQIKLSSITEPLGTSAPYLSDFVALHATHGLDYPLLSPVMLNLLAACIAPSPTFDSLPSATPQHPASSGVPTEFRLSQSRLTSPHFSTLESVLKPNHTLPPCSFPIPSSCFNISVAIPRNASLSPQAVLQGRWDPFSGPPDSTTD